MMIVLSTTAMSQPLNLYCNLSFSLALLTMHSFIIATLLATASRSDILIFPIP
jgi:hypothetical protein